MTLKIRVLFCRATRRNKGVSSMIDNPRLNPYAAKPSGHQSLAGLLPVHWDVSPYILLTKKQNSDTEDAMIIKVFGR